MRLRDTPLPRIAAACLLAVAVLAAAVGARAWPRSPVSLRFVLERSEAVVVADVVMTGRLPQDAFQQDTLGRTLSHVALLEVERVVVGPLDPGARGRLRVAYQGGPTSCPPGPHYERGRRVLAFLARPEHDDAPAPWITPAMAAATKHLDDAAFETYAERIAEYPAITALPESAARDAALRSWLARLAAEPATLGEALLDFARRPRGALHQRSSPLLAAMTPEDLALTASVLARDDAPLGARRQLARELSLIPAPSRRGLTQDLLDTFVAEHGLHAED